MVIRTMPPGSALFRALVDEWGPEAHLLANVSDTLAAANWQRAGDKNTPRPQPIPRPGSRVEKTVKQETFRDRALALRSRQQKRVTDG